jgi:hypothetical protein
MSVGVGAAGESGARIQESAERMGVTAYGGVGVGALLIRCTQRKEQMRQMGHIRLMGGSR